MASPIFLYLSDDPQAYLLFLKDYIRPSTDVCYNCKVRWLDNFIKTASAPDLGWNRISPDERLRPAHTFLDVQLADLGINPSNNYGLDLSEEEIDQIFQPAVRRLTLDTNWYTLVDAFAAMTCYRAMGRPDRAHNLFDQYKLGKKMLWMACPRFTAQELVRPRPTADIMASWLWNLAQLLSDGADAYLSRPSLPETGDEHHSASPSSLEPKPADPGPCTCPVFSALNGRHPDTYNGYEWINLVLRIAQQQMEPSLLEAWSQPLNEEEALHSSTPYRPLCPGYDCQTDRNWQGDQVHKRNNVVDASRLQNRMFEASVDLIRLSGAHVPDVPDVHPDGDNEEQQQQHMEEHETSGPDPNEGFPFYYAFVGPASAFSRLPESLQPGFLLPTGTPLTSLSISPAFFKAVLSSSDDNNIPPFRFAHSLRQTLLKAFLARTFRYSSPGCDVGEDKIPDLFVRSFFDSSFSSCHSLHTSTKNHMQKGCPLSLPPMKSIADHAARNFYKYNRSKILGMIPLDQNKNKKVKPFRMPRCQRIWGGSWEPNGFDFRPSSKAQGWRLSHGSIGELGGARAVDDEDACLGWGPRHMMRRVFEWDGEGGDGGSGSNLGWELDLDEGLEI
ncbi:hypothetical protein QBC32DRAFT_222534 [Pseudoneurospora amorphoporcata]|uniref:Uncharacterized protein n=1 Tax=Pseudoneurospora amorphoporcata TaxID=241081 RepID=A0AAN6NM83_9PEZI|nr:hypothetical protein QBC32DRAFT_222534 [Pseudoneurospora amorphoporcata]